METVSIKRSQLTRIALLAVILVMAALALVCIFLSFSLIDLPSRLAHFAEHHFFIAGFLLLVTGIGVARYYVVNISTNPKVSRRSKAAVFSYTTRNAVRASNLARQVLPVKTENASEFVKKEMLSGLSFPSEDVLTLQEDRNKRYLYLQRACSMGNLYKQKVIICFKTQAGDMHTLGTIWHFDHEHVLLKGGAYIPVTAVKEVIF